MISFRYIFEEHLFYFSFIHFCVDILNPSAGNQIWVGIPYGGVSLETNFHLGKLHFKYSSPRGFPTGIA